MSATNGGDGGGSAPAPRVYNEGGESMNRCKRCELTYLPSKSSSALKLTYCSFFCELGDLGFSMDSLERMEQRERIEADEAEIEETDEEPAAEPAS